MHAQELVFSITDYCMIYGSFHFISIHLIQQTTTSTGLLAIMRSTNMVRELMKIFNICAENVCFILKLLAVYLY